MAITGIYGKYRARADEHVNHGIAMASHLEDILEAKFPGATIDLPFSDDILPDEGEQSDPRGWLLLDIYSDYSQDALEARKVAEAFAKAGKALIWANPGAWFDDNPIQPEIDRMYTLSGDWEEKAVEFDAKAQTEILEAETYIYRVASFAAVDVDYDTGAWPE